MAGQSSVRSLKSLDQETADVKQLKNEESTPLSAILIFAKNWQLSNLIYLRNLMLDQRYIANYRLHSLQILL